MTKCQVAMNNVAVFVLTLNAAVAAFGQAPVAQHSADGTSAPCLHAAADGPCAVAVPAPCPPQPLRQAPSPLPFGDRLGHLLQAAAHLEAAGEMQQAAQVRKLAASEGQSLSVPESAVSAAASTAPPAPGSQQVLVKLRVCEVPRSRMKELGLDLPIGAGGTTDTPREAAAVPGRSPWSVGQKNAVLDRFDSLKKKGVLRTLAEPTIVAVSGRPASFHSGGQALVARPTPDGSATLDLADTGTRVDLIAIATAPDRLQLEVRMQVSEVSEAHSVKVGDTLAPAIRTRSVNTRAEIQSGQALVLGGLVQHVSKPATPSNAAEDPAAATEDVELLFLVMPEIIDAAEMARAWSVKVE